MAWAFPRLGHIFTPSSHLKNKKKKKGKNIFEEILLRIKMDAKKYVENRISKFQVKAESVFLIFQVSSGSKIAWHVIITDQM